MPLFQENKIGSWTLRNNTLHPHSETFLSINDHVGVLYFCVSMARPIVEPRVTGIHSNLVFNMHALIRVCLLPTEEVHHPNCGCGLLRKVGCNETIRHKTFVSRNARHCNDLTAHGGKMSVQALLCRTGSALASTDGCIAFSSYPVSRLPRRCQFRQRDCCASYSSIIQDMQRVLNARLQGIGRISIKSVSSSE